MSKRSRLDNSLTGGTGDVNPQWLSGSVTQTANGATTTAKIVLPIQRLQGTSGKSMVIEVLKVVWESTLTGNAGVDYSMELTLSTKDNGTFRPGITGGTVFAYYSRYVSWINAVGPNTIEIDEVRGLPSGIWSACLSEYTANSRPH